MKNKILAIFCTKTSTFRRSQLWYGKFNTKWQDELLRNVKNEAEIQTRILRKKKRTHTHIHFTPIRRGSENKWLYFYSPNGSQRYSKSTQINFEKMITFEVSCYVADKSVLVEWHAFDVFV